MTDREKEIKIAERKALAEVRAWKRNAAKRTHNMTPEEEVAYYNKIGDELRAKGFNVIRPAR
jgi:hypothetical protein